MKQVGNRSGTRYTFCHYYFIFIYNYTHIMNINRKKTRGRQHEGSLEKKAKDWDTLLVVSTSTFSNPNTLTFRLSRRHTFYCLRMSLSFSFSSFVVSCRVFSPSNVVVLSGAMWLPFPSLFVFTLPPPLKCTEVYICYKHGRWNISTSNSIYWQKW